MTIQVENLYKRYISNYIIKDFNFEFQSSIQYGVQGPNGSGKSTLLQILSGFLSPSKGSIKYSKYSGDPISRNEMYRWIAMVAPYMELDMELTPKEIFTHLKLFKEHKCSDISDLMNLSMLVGNEEKQLKHFSSGMAQRFSLTLAIISDAELLLLDEPTSFLDERSKGWFIDMLQKFTKEKTLIIASNDPFDFQLVDEVIPLNK